MSKQLPKAVNLSGVVYVKDPRDIAKIQELRAKIVALETAAKSLYSEAEINKRVKAREKELDKKQDLLVEASENVNTMFHYLKESANWLSGFAEEYKRLRNMTLKQVVSESIHIDEYFSNVEEEFRNALDHKKIIESRLSKLGF